MTTVDLCAFLQGSDVYEYHLLFPLQAVGYPPGKSALRLPSLLVQPRVLASRNNTYRKGA